MQKNERGDWPEIIFGTSDSRQSQAIARAIKNGTLRKIAPKIYTSNWADSPEEIIKKYRYHILGQLFPKGVISHRSALEGGISPDGSVILSYKYTRTIKLPGFTIRLIKGPGPDEEDMPFLENLFISSQGRAFLENMQKSRARKGETKTIPLSQIENRLDRFIRIFGQDEINNLRDQAKRVAKRLGMEEAYVLLDKMIGALLGTRPETELSTETARLRSQGLPVDPGRIELFAALTAYLMHAELPAFPSKVTTKQAKINQAFFEAYFSNYIEGTEFAIEEAEKIIFENIIFPQRPEDSHDVLSTYQIISNEQGMHTVPESPDQLIALLLERHAVLMQAREDKLPGKFKNVVNRAGNTVFVNPEEVRGTLIKGFDFYQKLKPGLARALFMMFLIAEVHPFVDGNGRMARIFMNADLDTTNLCRIIIPTVYREDYLLRLRKLSRSHNPDAYARMLSTAQRFTHSISFDNYNHALMQLRSKNAFLEPSAGKLIV